MVKVKKFQKRKRRRKKVSSNNFFFFLSYFFLESGDSDDEIYDFIPPSFPLEERELMYKCEMFLLVNMIFLQFYLVNLKDFQFQCF
jgi:hypothetical protein